MVGGLALVVEAHVVGHGVGRRHPHGRFVHVVPDAGDADVGEHLVLPPPPRARGGTGEVGEHAVARLVRRVDGPDRPFEQGAVGVLDEVIAGHSLVEDAVARLLGRMRIEDQYGAEALCAQVGDELRRIGEALGTPGEGLELVLVVDVEPQRVGRHLLLPERVGQPAHACLGV